MKRANGEISSVLVGRMVISSSKMQGVFAAPREVNIKAKKSTAGPNVKLVLSPPIRTARDTHMWAKTMIMVEVKGPLDVPGRRVLKEIARIRVYRSQGGTMLYFRVTVLH